MLDNPLPGSPRGDTALDAILNAEAKANMIQSQGEDVGSYAARAFRKRHTYRVL